VCALMFVLFAVLMVDSPVTGFPAHHGIQQPSTLDPRAELVKLEDQWNRAHLRGDANSLNQLWADELVVTVQQMPLMDKGQALQIVRSGRVKFKRYDTTDVKISVFGDAAIATGELHRRREKQGQDIEDNWRFTKVYVRRGGKWQVVAWHGSQAAN
jgi:ketosteroid isomerase-like protein